MTPEQKDIVIALARLTERASNGDWFCRVVLHVINDLRSELAEARGTPKPTRLHICGLPFEDCDMDCVERAQQFAERRKSVTR